MSVPLLSLSGLADDGFVADLGRSFREFGFAMVCDHGIDPALIAQGWAAARALFTLPLAAKAAYAIPGSGGQRGYTGLGIETAKDSSAPDLKEFWHVGREAGPSTPGDAAAAASPNIWPAEVTDFRSTMLALYGAFELTGARLLSAIARHLGSPADWFDDRIADGDSILRLIHYPPVKPGERGERSAPHEDINLITLLLGAEEPGLQLLSRSDEWIDVAPPPGALVVNVGDMLQRLSNDVLPSTRHRVVNPAGPGAERSRFAMPFFVHLRGDVMIEPLPQCVSRERPARYPPISAHDYLRERLIEIGLVAKA